LKIDSEEANEGPHRESKGTKGRVNIGKNLVLNQFAFPSGSKMYPQWKLDILAHALL
jgi:hypothetical protein